MCTSNDVFLTITTTVMIIITFIYRLQKQKKELEDKKYFEKIEMESRLAVIAEQRQRTKNIFAITPPVVNDSRKDKNSDDVSKASSTNSTKKDQQIKGTLPKLNLKKGTKFTNERENNEDSQVTNIKIGLTIRILLLLLLILFIFIFRMIL